MKQNSPQTPAALGYTMPAEWEPHEGTWLSWPHKEASWPGAFEPVPAVFAQIVKNLTDSEFVRINVADKEWNKQNVGCNNDSSKTTVYL